MKSVIGLGKTYEAAIEQALLELKATIDQVVVEVLEEGKKGILGIGYSPYKVKVMFNEISTQDEDNETLPPASKIGSIGIENGQLIKSGDFTMQAPTLVPCKYAHVFVNGEEIDGPVKISESDEIMIEIEQVNEQPEWSIRLNESLTEASLNYDPGHQVVRKLIDQSPLSRLTLRIEEKVVEECSVTVQDVIKKSRELGITAELNNELIEQVLKEKRSQEIIIAKGKKPIPGKDGRVDLYINLEDTFVPPLELPDGTLDFRETRKIPHVQEGDLIGQILPPTNGEEGISVTGDILSPVNGVELKVSVSDKIQIDSNGEIIALQEGRPKLELTKNYAKLDIVKKLVHEGDLTFANGNIRFNGDVDVTGNVEDGMEIEAKGEISIIGTVSNGKLFAPHTISIGKSLISSYAYAGKSDVIVTKLCPLLLKIETYIGYLLNGIQQLMASQQHSNSSLNSINIRGYVRILLEKKLMELIPIAKTYETTIQNDNVTQSDLIFINDMLFSLLNFHSSSMYSLEELLQLKEHLRGVIEINSKEVDPSVQIACGYSIHSQLYSDGDIHVLGKGCYNSILQAKGSILVSGLVRGGSVRAGKHIKIRSVGSSTGVKTSLMVESYGVMELGEVHEDVTIQIGKQIFTFYEYKKNIYAHIDYDGQISLEKNA
ncbi:flagellar assembly protein A [Bacillus salitolerans]|uniref:Flagellar assembly protein A n=1 Tax=Bacillus salitolerans TaxID=1437434 RepID=A0ABW4LM87_9BACI